LSKRVNEFLNFNNILAGEQFGFRQNLSIDKAMFNFRDEILSALNNKMDVDRISCDFESIFIELEIQLVSGLNHTFMTESNK
jgi:hypothetical protein